MAGGSSRRIESGPVVFGVYARTIDELRHLTSDFPPAAKEQLFGNLIRNGVIARVLKGRGKSKFKFSRRVEDHHPFVAKIAENTDEDTPPLVYADWLQEQGYDVAAAFVRRVLRPPNERHRVLTVSHYMGSLVHPDPMQVYRYDWRGQPTSRGRRRIKTTHVQLATPHPDRGYLTFNLDTDPEEANQWHRDLLAEGHPDGQAPRTRLSRPRSRYARPRPDSEYTVRFNLQAGPHFGHWEVIHVPTGETVFHDPETVTLRMTGARLVNWEKAAARIHSGAATKHRVAWVGADRVEVEPPATDPPGPRVSYNPRVAPNWVDHEGANVDNAEYPVLVTRGRGVYLAPDAARLSRRARRAVTQGT